MSKLLSVLLMFVGFLPRYREWRIKMARREIFRLDEREFRIIERTLNLGFTMDDIGRGNFRVRRERPSAEETKKELEQIRRRREKLIRLVT